MDSLKALRVILVLALASLAFGWVFGTPHLYGLAAGLLAIGLLSDRLTGWIAAGWMKLAGWLGAFNSRVVLGLIFYLVLTPIALLYRWFNPEAMRLHPTETESYFEVMDERITGDDFEKPW